LPANSVFSQLVISTQTAEVACGTSVSCSGSFLGLCSGSEVLRPNPHDIIEFSETLRA
jgi:hypothetical protein